MGVDSCSSACRSITGTSDVLMARVASYIAANYPSRIRMADLALHVNVSTRTLQNLFRLHCGEPPLNALRRFRLHKLHAALQQRPWSPLRIHFDRCGLTGSIADRHLFLSMFGVTIREYQHACRHSRSAAVAVMPPLREARAELRHFLLPSA